MLVKRTASLVFSASLISFGVTSCGKKDEPAPPEEDSDVAVEVAEPVAGDPAPPVAKASVADRAAKLGFAQHLPKNTQGFLAVYDGQGLVEELRASKLGKFVEEMAAGEGVDLDDVNEDPQAGMFLSLLKEEFFVAVGEGTPKQSAKLQELQALSSFSQMKTLVEMGAAGMSGEAPDLSGFDESYMGFLKEPGVVAKLLDGAQMPPVTIGFKVSDEDARMGLAQMIAGGLAEGVAMLGPDGEDVAEEVKIPAKDTELTGIRLLGDKVVAKFKEENEEDVEAISEYLGAAQAAEVFNALATKNILAAAGVIGDYVVIFAGTNPEEFVMPASPEESLVAHSDMAFIDGFLDKKLIMACTLSKPLMESLGDTPNTLGNMANGIKAGLEATDAFGDTQDIEVLLDLVGTQEAALMGMFDYLPAGLVAYREQGYKLEGFGGSTRPDADLTSKHAYGALADWEGAVFYASGIGTKEYTEKALEWLDTMGETFYLAGKKMSQLESAIEDPDLKQFQEGFGMFDQMFREDALKIWKALREDMTAGLGSEAVILVDLKGGLPTVPGVPPVLLKEAKAPRFAMVAPITDRERLKGSWQNLNSAAESILSKLSEMTGENIPMQRPMSSEKDDLVTWFFQIPFQTEDFLLSVSLDEDTFYATSSKTLVKEISAKVDAGGGSVTGEHVRIDVATLRAYLGDLLTLAEDNAAEIWENEAEAEGFLNDLPQVRAVLDAFSEIQSLNGETQLEGGRPHTTIHLHVE